MNAGKPVGLQSAGHRSKMCVLQLTQGGWQAADGMKLFIDPPGVLGNAEACKGLGHWALWLLRTSVQQSRV